MPSRKIKPVLLLVASVIIMQFIVSWTVNLIYSFFDYGAADTYVLIVATEIFAVLLPVLIYVRFHGSGILTIEKVKFSVVLVGIILGISAQLVAQIINIPMIIWLAPPPSDISVSQATHSIITGIVVVALIPAICEELLMRGVMLSAFKKYGTMLAVIISALCFAGLHSSVTNLPGLIFLGLVLGYITILEGSVLLAVTVHFASNAFGMVFDWFAGKNQLAMPFLTDLGFRIGLAVASAILMVFIICLRRNKINAEK